VQQNAQRTEIDKNDNHLSPARRQALLDELRDTVEAAHDGDERSLSRVGEALKELPSLADIFADLANEAERAVIKRGSGAAPLVEGALPVELKAMRDELCGPHPSALE
jgi:hypothetical protein